MKCLTHRAEAVAVCAYCGRALCVECDRNPGSPRMVCSDVCATALARNERALEQILQQGRQSARASAFYSFLCGGVSAAGAAGASFFLPVPFLIWFTAGCSAVFVVSGLWHVRIARQPR